MPEPNLLSDPIQAPPQEFSSQDGTIAGLIDGTNTVFSVGPMLRRAQVWKNGLLMTLNVDCAVGAPTRYVVFLEGHIPQIGDKLFICGWI